MERLNISYIEEVNAFHTWLLTNPTLSSSARLLWFSLMHYCNSCGWKAAFNVPLSALEADTGLKKDAIKRARNALQQAGLIDFQSRQGRQSTLYKVIPLTAQKTQLNNFTAQKTPQTAPQTAPIPRLEETRLEEGEDEGGRARARVAPETWSAVLTAYQNNIHPVASPIERDRLVDLVKDYGAEWVLEAVKVAALARASTIRYVEAVLRRWSSTGLARPWEDRPAPSPRARAPRNSKKEAIDVVNRLMAEYQAKEGEEKDDNGSIDPASDWSFATGVQK